VVIRIARVEMGQGTLTGLSQLVAEELECDWSKVTTEYPSPGQNVARNRVWGEFQTAGSRGIRTSEDYVRKGGAAARMMLVQAAADGWKVPASECKVSKGVITHGASNRSTTYGKVADAAAKIEPPKDVKLKDPKDWTIAGKPLKRLDTVDKLNGKQIYSIDLKLPGMLNAAIKETPVPGGKVKSFDAAKIEKMPGVKKVIMIDGTGVAVVADTWYRAKTALDALEIVWDEGANANVSSESIAAMLKEGLDAKDAFVGNKAGDVTAALAGAAKKIEAVYSYPYQSHMTMEPMNATAVWTAEKCNVWTATQNAEAALATAVTAAGLPIEKCDVTRLNLGGGFGRRSSSHDFVRQAVLIAKEMPGTPVKLIWSREQDVTHGTYHPITQCKMVGGLDDKGNPVAMHMRISGQSILAGLRPEALVEGRDPAQFQGLNAKGPEGQLGYDIPNLLVDHAMRNPPFRPGFWRGVNNNQNAIYLESFVDEMAHAAGQDPLEFRRKMMKDFPKHLAVLNTVAEKAGWGKPAAPGVYRGLAQHMGYGS
jgi:isoquinoline 1-oxidoreductase beta subunit